MSALPAPRVARLVALDIDGTLLDHDLGLSERVRRAVLDLVAGGHHVVLATGRSLLATLPIVARLGLRHGYAVCSNGAVTIRYGDAEDGLPHGYEVVDLVTFDPADAVWALRVELPGAAYAVEELGRGFAVTGPFPVGELEGEVREVGFEELVRTPATRVVVRSPDHTPQDFLELTARLGLKGVNYAVGWTAWLDLAPEGVSKASALEGVRERLGVPPRATFAAGDGRNDLEMLGWAARSVAMGQAPAEVLAAADEVAPPVDGDGLAPVLEQLAGAGATAPAAAGDPAGPPP